MTEGPVARRIAIARLRARLGRDPEAEAGELNIVPLLDVVVNTMLFMLATLATIFTATIPVPAPGHQPGPGPARQGLTVKLVREGYIVATPSGFVQPGCAGVGAAAVTIPLRHGRHDTAALTRCLERTRGNTALGAPPAGEQRIQIAANGELPYDVLVQTLDAARETRPGANDLYTRPELGTLN